MSDTPVPEATPEATPEANETQAQPASGAELPQLTPEQIEKIVSGYKAKVKIEDQEQEVPFDELRRGYQLRQVSDRRMNDAHKEKQKIHTLIEQLKANPEAALKELGIDPLRFSEEQLTRHIQSLKMSPEERRIMEREMQIAEREKALQAQEAARKQQEEAALQAQEAARLDQELTEALEAEKFPRSPYAVKQVASVMREYLVRGYQISARDAVKIARDDIQRDVQHFIDNLPPEQLMAMAPNGVEALRKSLVAKATGGFPQAASRQNAPKPEEKPAQKRRGSLDRWMRDAMVYND